ncbi:MAG: ABC transporter permease [Pleomorphochaeta sp.]
MRRAKGIISILLISSISLILIIFMMSKDPLYSLYQIFLGPLSSSYFFGNTISHCAPLIIGSVGIAVAYRTNLINLGGDGQMYMGALVANIIAINFVSIGKLSIFVGLIAASIIGALIAFISAYLKVKFDTSELISSYLISIALTYFTSYLITGPFQDPNSNLQSTRKVTYMLNKILPPSILSTSIIYAIIIALIFYLIFNYTKFGYETKIIGYNKEFARYGGISLSKNYLLSFSISGALLSFSGALYIFSNYESVFKGFSSGLGFSALTICLISFSKPLLIIPIAFFITLINQGSIIAMQNSDISSDVALLFQAIIFLLISSKLLLGEKKNDNNN